METYGCNTRGNSQLRRFGPGLLALVLSVVASSASAALSLDVAKWKADKQKLILKGTGGIDKTVTVVNANDVSQILATRTLTKNTWTFRKRNLDPVPCTVLVLQSNGKTDGPLDVENRPSDCEPASPPVELPPPSR